MMNGGRRPLSLLAPIKLSKTMSANNKFRVLQLGIVLGCLHWVPSAGAEPEHLTSDYWNVRGIVKAEAQATISSELVAQVDKIPFKAGESFRSGDAIIVFDCRRYKADLRAAEAEVETARVKVKTNTALKLHNAVGTEELETSKARLNQVIAEMQSISVKTDQCIIKAPFDGRVVERKIHEHEMSEAGTPLIQIVKDGDLELDLIVPSNWMLWLKPGLEFQFHVDETNSMLTASLLQVGAVVDPISKTAQVSAKIIEPPQSVRPGMSGTATFTPPNG